MSQDATVGGGYGGGDAGGQGQQGPVDQTGGWGGAVVGLINTVIGQFWHQTQGSGTMAARGAAEAAIKTANIRYREQLLGARASAAWAQFARTNPYEAGFAVEVPVADAPPDLAAGVQKMAVHLAELQALPTTKVRRSKIAKLQKRIALRANKLAPFTGFRVAELYGANAGYWRERGAPPPTWLLERSH